MKITNKNNLPQPLVDALINDSYTRGLADYSVSDLTSPARQVVLKKRHIENGEEFEQDVSDSIWALLGTAFHSLMEKAKEPGSMVEERMYMIVPNGVDKNIIISGKKDRYKDGTITDWKMTSVWSAIFRSHDEEWTQKLNCYATLARKNDLLVSRLEIVAIWRDWMKSKVKTKAGYPDLQVSVLEMPLWNEIDAEKFVIERAVNLDYCNTLLDDDLPACTKEEMWETDTVYALMKVGNVKAINAQARKREDAQKFLDYEAERLAKKPGQLYGNPEKAKDKFYIQERPGTRKRCVNYCDASGFCNIYKKWAEENPELVEAEK